MKKLFDPSWIFAIMLAFTSLMSFDVMAAEPTLSAKAHVGADTNFVFRGQSLSQRGLSGNFDASVSAYGVTGTYTIHGVSLGNTNLLHVVDANYGTKVFDQINVAAGITAYAFTGGATAGVAASNANFNEVYAQAGAYGLTAKYAVRTQVNHDEAFTLGYSLSVFDKTTLSAGYEHLVYGIRNVTANNYSAGVSYNFTPDVVANAKYHYVGNVNGGLKGANQVVASIGYTF